MPSEKNIAHTQLSIEELVLNLYLIKASSFLTKPENSIFNLLIDKRICEVLDILTFDEIMLIKLSLDGKRNKFIKKHANKKLELTIEDVALEDLISNLHTLLFQYMNSREESATIRLAELIPPLPLFPNAGCAHDEALATDSTRMEAFISNLDSFVDDTITDAIDELQNEESARSSTVTSMRMSFSMFSPPEQMSYNPELIPLHNENAEKQQP